MLTQHESSRGRDLHIHGISNAPEPPLAAPPSRKPRGKPFGTDGHYGGRPPGSRNKTTLLAESLLDGEMDNIVRRTIDHAMAGHPTAMRLVVERLVPRRSRRAPFELPPIHTKDDAIEAMKRVPALVAAGELDAREGASLAATLDQTYRALQHAENSAQAAELIRNLRFGQPTQEEEVSAEPPPAASEPAAEEVPQAEPEPDAVVTSAADADALELPTSYMDGDGAERARRELGLDPRADGMLAVLENPDLVAPRLISWNRQRSTSAGTG